MKRPEDSKHDVCDELPLLSSSAIPSELQSTLQSSPSISEVHWLNWQSEFKSSRYGNSEKNEALLMFHDVDVIGHQKSLTIISSRSTVVKGLLHERMLGRFRDGQV